MSLLRPRLKFVPGTLRMVNSLFPVKENGSTGMLSQLQCIFNVPNPPPTLQSKRPQTERPFTEPPPKKRCAGKVQVPPLVSFEDVEETVTPVTKSISQKLKSVQNKLYRTQQQLKNICDTTPSLETVTSQLSKYLPDATADFVKMQMSMFMRDKRGRRWDATDKAMALSIYHASKKAYTLLCKLFVLPSISTLRKTVQNIQIFPGLSQPVISLLAQKVDNMSAAAKLCSLEFDEMSIKRNVSYSKERDEVEGLEDFGFYGRTKFVANHATVFLARGLIVNWKQPVRYFLSSGSIRSVMLKRLIFDCVQRLIEVGLDVKCVLADQGSNNRKALKDLGVSEDTPVFVVDERKILAFYDPPHLLKNIRNNFKKSGFKTDKGSVEWRHVVNFYNIDSQNTV